MMTETMMATTLRAHLHPPRIFCANFSNTDAPQSREVKRHEHAKSGRHFSSRQPTRAANNRQHHRQTLLSVELSELLQVAQAQAERKALRPH